MVTYLLPQQDAHLFKIRIWNCFFPRYPYYKYHHHLKYLITITLIRKVTGMPRFKFKHIITTGEKVYAKLDSSTGHIFENITNGRIKILEIWVFSEWMSETLQFSRWAHTYKPRTREDSTTLHNVPTEIYQTSLSLTMISIMQFTVIPQKIKQGTIQSKQLVILLGT